MSSFWIDVLSVITSNNGFQNWFSNLPEANKVEIEILLEYQIQSNPPKI
jgi:hypothetical protein